MRSALFWLLALVLLGIFACCLSAVFDGDFERFAKFGLAFVIGAVLLFFMGVGANAPTRELADRHERELLRQRGAPVD